MVENGHLAFICEDGYKEGNRTYAFATVEKPNDEGLAFAANALPLPLAAKANPSLWKPGEYEEYLELKKKRPEIPVKQFAMPPPPPGAPAGVKFGKLCFNCGWNKDHDSRSCPVMYNAPPNKFTPEMMNLVRFDPKTDPHSIGGKPINQQCASGVYGTY